jgi:sulfide:quinone oxidoreductase
VEPLPATRILRAQLMTGERPLYLRGTPGEAGEVSRSPLWEPPGKIAGRYLSWFIAAGEPARELTDVHRAAPTAKITA